MRRNGRFWLNSFPLELLGQIGTPQLAQTVLNKMLGSPVSLEAPFKFYASLFVSFYAYCILGNCPFSIAGIPDFCARGGPTHLPTYKTVFGSRQFWANSPFKNATLKAFHDRFEGLMALLSLARICWDPQFWSSFMLYTFVLFEVNRICTVALLS